MHGSLTTLNDSKSNLTQRELPYHTRVVFACSIINELDNRDPSHDQACERKIHVLELNNYSYHLTQVLTSDVKAAKPELTR